MGYSDSGNNECPLDLFVLGLENSMSCGRISAIIVNKGHIQVNCYSTFNRHELMSIYCPKKSDHLLEQGMFTKFCLSQGLQTFTFVNHTNESNCLDVLFQM